uniref:RING-CH-type domain-containing protein n=1 Tax=Elaeophora elaphi TaxID=1147741 RepID=A0A0R3RKY5_9BILA
MESHTPIEDWQFSDLARKYCRDGRRFSDDCRYALYIRTLDRKAPVNAMPYSSHLSDIGALCETCTGHPFVNGTCPKIIDQRIVFGSSTLHSFTVTDCSTLLPNETLIEKFCRICHSFGSSGDPLISPCRCTGSLQYVHISCLLHWLTICAHKLKRPAICELCLYKYRLRNIVDWQNLRLPSISRHDLRYLIVFIIAVMLMFLSSVTSLICFCIEKNLEKNDTIEDNPETIMKGSGDWETLLSSSTVLSALLFFVALFIAIYAHIKAGQPICYFFFLF